MSYSTQGLDKSVRKSISGPSGLNLEEDGYRYDEDDPEEGEIDPSLIAPDGLRLRIRRTTIQNPPDLNIHRTALTVTKKHDTFDYERPCKPGFRETIKNNVKKKSRCTAKDVKKKVYLRLPILDWLFHYNINRDLFNDVISGITVAVMNIPQGMAYAMLAELDPIVGIYMAFFPVLIYATFASSRHCSMGTFAVICIMSGKVIGELATFPDAPTNSTLLAAASNSTGTEYSNVEVASILSFAVGIWMFIFGLLNLGSLCVFLSDMLVSGFTTGASIHVLTSQVPKLFGIDSESYQGVFKIPKTWWSILQNILYSNPTTMVISLTCFLILIINNEIMKPRLRQYTRIPFPIELVVVVVGTLASRYGHLNEDFDVEIVGEIPTGLPPPVTPPFQLYTDVLLDSFIITIVSYTVSFSMAKIFAKRLDYLVDATQELYALGLGNVMGSFFSCAPISASLSRSLIQQSVGGATQLASYISCSILVLVLLFIGPFFEDLPNCVLAAIIAVALKGMFLQFGDVYDMWKLSKSDALVWIVSFLGVVILDIDYGLLVGIAASLLLIIVRNQAPVMVLLGRVEESDLYLDLTRYFKAKEVPGIKICQVFGNLHFANAEAFREKLVKTTGLDPRSIMKWKKKQAKLLKKKLEREQEILADENSHKIPMDGDIEKPVGTEPSPENEKKTEAEIKKEYEASLEPELFARAQEDSIPGVVSLIIDYSGVSQIDISAGKNLIAIQKEYKAADVEVVFASLPEQSLEMCLKSEIVEELSEELFFHSVSDAVAFLTSPEKVSSQTGSTHTL